MSDETQQPTMDDVIAVAEQVLKAVWDLIGHEIKTPFLRMTYDESMRLYGNDKPDMRLPPMVAVPRPRLVTSRVVRPTRRFSHCGMVNLLAGEAASGRRIGMGVNAARRVSRAPHHSVLGVITRR